MEPPARRKTKIRRRLLAATAVLAVCAAGGLVSALAKVLGTHNLCAAIRSPARVTVAGHDRVMRSLRWAAGAVTITSP
jgi:hypothetical protein